MSINFFFMQNLLQKCWTFKCAVFIFWWLKDFFHKRCFLSASLDLFANSLWDCLHQKICMRSVQLDLSYDALKCFLYRSSLGFVSESKCVYSKCVFSSTFFSWLISVGLTSLIILKYIRSLRVIVIHSEKGQQGLSPIWLDKCFPLQQGDRLTAQPSVQLGDLWFIAFTDVLSIQHIYHQTMSDSPFTDWLFLYIWNKLIRANGKNEMQFRAFK